MLEKIKYYFKKGLYKTEHLGKLLSVGAVTETEYNIIIKENENG